MIRDARMMHDRLAEAFVAGELPSCTYAKIGVSPYNKCYVIYVGTYNYADLDNVSSAYDELYAIGMMQVCESLCPPQHA